MSDSIVVRKLPPGVKQGLRERAAAQGRSVEAEVRAILVDVVFPPEGEGSWVLEFIENTRKLPPGPELELPPRGPDRPLPDFS